MKDWISTAFKVYMLGMTVLVFWGCTVSRSEQPEPNIDQFLMDLSDKQLMELIVWMDQLSAWDARGGIGPEPEPPDWLKDQLVSGPRIQQLMKQVPRRRGEQRADISPGQKSWVNVYVNEFGCSGCNRFKAWLSKQDLKKLPVEFRIKSGNEIPAWVDSVPTFHWNTPEGKTFYSQGWSDPEKLLKSFSS